MNLTTIYIKVYIVGNALKHGEKTGTFEENGYNLSYTSSAQLKIGSEQAGEEWFNKLETLIRSKGA